MKNQKIPFSERRSMRSIMNVYIMQAEKLGFKDINDWIDFMIKESEKRLENKHKQYSELQKDYNLLLEKVEKDENTT